MGAVHPISRVGRWYVVLLIYTALFLAINLEVASLLLKYNGQHIPTTDVIILSSSLDQDVESMNDTTSISQFGVETARGMVMLLFMTLGAAGILVGISFSDPKRKRNWGNVIGYAAVALVGIFGDQLPGTTPRRNYNIVLGWTVDSSITNVIHLTAAAIFLFVPIISTLIWWWKQPHPDWRWITLYVLLLCVNATYGAMDLFAQQSDMLRGEWYLFEMGSFGPTFLGCATFELWLLDLAESVSPVGYSQLKTVLTE
jgi:hypothetical protein